MRLSSWSSTGPQYCDWHSASVANITARGLPLPTTSLNETAWSGHAGTRVQIGFTPRGFAAVGEAARGAAVPTSGASGFAFTCTANGTFLPGRIATAL